MTSTARPRRSRPAGRSDPLADPPALSRPALFDTGVWTWARDRRFPQLATWFNGQARAGRVLVCDLVVVELVRLAPNARRAAELAARLGSFPSIAMPDALWRRAHELQLALAATGDHRRVPPVDLLLAVAAEAAAVPLVHYDRDYERIGAVSDLQHIWLMPDGALA